MYRNDEKAIITEKQAIYLINNVLTPRLEYRLHSSFLTPNQLTILTNCSTNLVKSKAKLSRGVPNSFLFHPNIYGLKNISMHQPTILAKNLLKNINHPQFENSFLKIRLQDLQDSTKTHSHIFHETPLFPRNQLYTHTAQSILAIHATDIQFIRNITTDWPKPLPRNGTPINDIIIHHPKSHHLKEKLNHHDIRYIEQFLNFNNTELLNWQNFHHNIGKIPPGRTPQWFTEIQDLISNNSNPTTQYINPNPFTLTKWGPGKTPWVITSDLTIGKISRTTNQSVHIRHYTKAITIEQPLPRLRIKGPNPQKEKLLLHA